MDFTATLTAGVAASDLSSVWTARAVGAMIVGETVKQPKQLWQRRTTMAMEEEEMEDGARCRCQVSLRVESPYLESSIITERYLPLNNRLVPQ